MKPPAFLFMILLLALPACSDTPPEIPASSSDVSAQTAPAPAPEETTEDSVPEPQFSLPAGIYGQDDTSVTITAPEGYTIAFTTDGTTRPNPAERPQRVFGARPSARPPKRPRREATDLSAASRSKRPTTTAYVREGR